MSFEAVEKKILRPPAAHNVARLLDPSCEIKTTRNIAKFAVGIPSFNYIPALRVCQDRVALGVDEETALKAVRDAGAPAGRAQNASLVRAFYEFDRLRGYSKLRVLDSYEGQFRISRNIIVPTKPTFTILEAGKQVPVVLCGWKDFTLSSDQLRAWITMLESGLFSFTDYRNSPWEVVLFPEAASADGNLRTPRVIKKGDVSLFTETQMRELAAMYARAQQAAMPIARQLWDERERKRSSRITPVEVSDVLAPALGDLFAKD